MWLEVVRTILMVVIIYMLIGTLIAGRLLPTKTFTGPKQAEKFTVDWILGWPLWGCLTLAFIIASIFYKGEDR